MADASEPDLAALRADAILDFEMAGLHTDAYTEPVYCEHATSVDGRFAGYVLVR
jgi:hypothetical protein